jgi:transposase
MSEGKIIEIFNKGLGEVIDTMKTLSNQIKEQQAKIDQLSKENKELNNRMKTLENSSKKTVKIVANHRLATSLRRKLNH